MTISFDMDVALVDLLTGYNVSFYYKKLWTAGPMIKRTDISEIPACLQNYNDSVVIICKCGFPLHLGQALLLFNMFT